MTEEILDNFSVDNNGNLYYDNYWLYINKDDNIDFFKIYKHNNKYISKVSTDIKDKEEALQIKMIETEIEDLKNKFNDVDNAYDFNEEDALHLKKYIYNPELKYVKEKHQSEEEQVKQQLNKDDMIEEDDINETNEYEPYISIHGDFNLNNNNFDDIANYEVYLIDNNNLISYTELVYDNPLYRISILVNNNKFQLQLNIIGTKTITYDMEKSDDENKPIKLKVISIQYQII